jgi:hypothetical protein
VLAFGRAFPLQHGQLIPEWTLIRIRLPILSWVGSSLVIVKTGDICFEVGGQEVDLEQAQVFSV